MKSFTTQILLMIAAVFFLFKGGMGLLIGAWKMVLPILFLGGAYYFMKKALGGSSLPSGAYDAQRVKRPEREPNGRSSKAESNVIEICPHCLSEVGSCPKCR